MNYTDLSRKKMEYQTIEEISESDWEKQVEKYSGPIFVTFYSPDCIHCTRSEPIIAEIARDYGTEIKFVRINLLKSNYIGARYGIMATPTFITFCGGKPLQMRVGAVFPSMIKKMIEELINQGDSCRNASTEWKYEITGYG